MQTLHSLRSFRDLRAVSTGLRPRPTAFPIRHEVGGDGETPNPRGSHGASGVILMRERPSSTRQRLGAEPRCCACAACVCSIPVARIETLQWNRGQTRRTCAVTTALAKPPFRWLGFGSGGDGASRLSSAQLPARRLARSSRCRALRPGRNQRAGVALVAGAQCTCGVWKGHFPDLRFWRRS